MEESGEELIESTTARTERLSSETKAEVAREFRKTFNRSRPSRKRYSVSSAAYSRQQSSSDNANSLDASGRYATFSHSSRGFSPASSFEREGNPFVSSVRFDSDHADGGGGVSLGALEGGGEAIYREFEEQDSLSWFKNRLKKIVPQPIRNSLLPPRSWKEWRRFVFIHLPILHWLWKYTPNQLTGDLIAGITIGVTHIPQGIGFALLANLPPVYGLYSSFIPVILYSVFGSSRHISVGTFPVVALMVGNAVTRISSANSVCSDDSVNSTIANTSRNASTSGPSQEESDPCFQSGCETLAVDVAVTLSFLVGIIMIIMSLLRLGIITILLSDSLVSGYTAAAAFTILITQIKFLFGLNGDEAFVHPGLSTTPRRVVTFLRLIFTGRVNGAAIVTGLVCIIILIGVDQVNGLLRKYIRKIPIHIPAQLIVVILATGISFGAKLHSKYDLLTIETVGGIPPGKCYGLEGHGVTTPSPSLTGELISDAFVIAIISFVINISQAKLLAKKNSYTVHPDQEFFAYGVMNFGGSFFGSFPTAGALSRTVLQDATGGNTQLVGCISSAIVIFVILFLGTLFGPLPSAALAAIVVVALKGLYFQLRDIYKFYKLSLHDMWIWLVVFFSTLFIGLDIGLGIGVLFSLFLVMFRTVLPYSPALGEARAWHYPPEVKFADEDFDEEDLRVHRVQGIYIFQFNAPLYFASAGVFRSRLHIETGINPGEEARVKGPRGCFQKLGDHIRNRGQTTGGKRVNLEAQVKGESEDSVSDVNYNRLKDEGVEEEEEDGEDSSRGYPYHTLVLDCAPIAFVDSTGIAALEQVVKEFESVGVQVLLANPPTPLCEALNRFGFFRRYSSERLFPSVALAVRYTRDGNKVPALEQPKEPDLALASNLERQLLYSNRPSLFEAKAIELEHRGRTPTVKVSARHEETSV